MASDSHADDSGVDYSKLYVYAGPACPDIRSMTVYADDYLPVLDTDPGIHARIIGSSHAIRTVGGLPSYFEVTSCRPIGMADDFDPVMMEYDITRGVDDVLIRRVGDYRVEIAVKTRDAGLIQHPERWDLAYTFEGDGPSAPTAIMVGPTGWETVHEYPEFDTALYTETTFFRVGGVSDNGGV